MTTEAPKAVKITKDVSVKLDAFRRDKLAVELAQHVKEYGDLEARKKEISGDLTKKMKAQRKEIDRKSAAMLSGSIMEPTACEEIKDFDCNRILTRVIATGEIVGERPMAGEERQKEIDYDDVPDAEEVDVDGERATEDDDDGEDADAGH